MASKIPMALASRLAALTVLTGIGAGVALKVANDPAEIRQGLADPYVQAVAADNSTSPAVKIAMVMGHFYESSNKHIGVPYVDKAGRGQPLSVCNGVTGAGVVAGRYYTPAECYALERSRYTLAEHEARAQLPRWPGYSAVTQAVFIDFVWNKGGGALATSTARRKANAGDLAGACAEMPRWNKGTVNGVLQVLPGLQIRGDANGELCADGNAT